LHHDGGVATHTHGVVAPADIGSKAVTGCGHSQNTVNKMVLSYGF
jgi:hypothetical protein